MEEHMQTLYSAGVNKNIEFMVQWCNVVWIPG